MQMADIRRKVSALYDAVSWKDRVSRMPDRQVFAIYQSAKKSGKLDRKKPREDRREVKPQYYQYTIFDILESK